jgi:hypothetical protein
MKNKQKTEKSMNTYFNESERFIKNLKMQVCPNPKKAKKIFCIFADS